MKNRNNAVLTWLHGLHLQTNDHSRDEISSARILKLIEQKVELAERKKRRWLKGFGIGAIFVLSTVSVAGALIRADRQRGTSAVGAVCWMGRYEASTAVQIGRDISPENRCAVIRSAFRKHPITASQLHACVSSGGGVHVFEKTESCNSRDLKSLSSGYPYQRIDSEQIRGVVESVLTQETCVPYQRFEAKSFLELQQIGHQDWTITVTLNAQRSHCVVASVEPRTKTILVLPGVSK